MTSKRAGNGNGNGDCNGNGNGDGPGMVVGRFVSPGPGVLQAARKPNSVLDDHSSRRRITGPLEQPTRRFWLSPRLRLGNLFAWAYRASTLRPPEEERIDPCLFGLAPCGVYHADRLTPAAVRSYRTLSPLPSLGLRRGLGGLLSVALAVLPPCGGSPGRYPAHCPLEFGLSSPAPFACAWGGSDRPAACRTILR